MKKIVHQPGGRLYKGEDFLAMQHLTLELTEKIFAQYGNIILHGCEVDGGNISPGIVMLDGKACVFDGATNISSPFFVKKFVTIENVPYKTNSGEGYEIYAAVHCLGTDEGAFRLDGARQFKTMIADAIQPLDENLQNHNSSPEAHTDLMAGINNAIQSLDENLQYHNIDQNAHSNLLATETGQNTDRTMTQKAITDALDGITDNALTQGSGTWTPLTGTTGVTIVSSNYCFWQRIGKRIFVSGLMDVNVVGSPVVVDFRGIPASISKFQYLSAAIVDGQVLCCYLHPNPFTGTTIFSITLPANQLSRVHINGSYEID